MKSMTIRTFLKEPVVIFLAGAILSAAVDVAVGNVAQRYVSVLLILVSVFILYTAATFGEMRKGIEGQLDKLSLTSVWTHGPEETYQRAAHIVSSAQSSILVLNHYMLATPITKMPKERPEYMKAIETAIRKRLDNPANSPFVYKRILQSEKASQAQGILQRGLLNEEPAQTYEHCREVFRMAKHRPSDRSDRVEVALVISEPIASFPSMMIVDGKYVLVSIVSPSREFGETSTKFIGGLIIEDRTGQKVKDFERVFNRIYEMSSAIHAVED